jgi:hypothetical protein
MLRLVATDLDGTLLRADGSVSAAALLGDAIAPCDEAPTKLIARHPSLSADDLLARVHALGLDGFEVTHSRAPFVEVAAPGVTKARARSASCRRRARMLGAFSWLMDGI